MRRFFVVAAAVVSTAIFAGASGVATASPARADLPVVGGKPVLASINGEPLTLEEFERILGGIHAEAMDNTPRSMPHPTQLLERLINARLVLQEARNIGLDELPEVKSAEKLFAEDTLRSMLYGYHVRNIVKPDPKEVEKRYREAVKEVKVSSVLFEKEDDAKRMEAEIRTGGKFEALAAKKVAAKEAKGGGEARFLKFASLSPEVAKAVSSMKKGTVSQRIKVGTQFALLKVEGVRYPIDPAARKEAENEVLQTKRVAALTKYTAGLRKRYAKVDRKVLDGLDYDAAGSGFDRFRDDGRVVATVKGEAPVTVADLTATIEKKFFHGMEQAAEKRRINRKKEQVLEEILTKRVTLKEARIQKLDRTEFFRVKSAENRNGVLFGAFVQKVIAPDVKVIDEELQAYYKEHVADYTFPEMLRVDGMMFSARKDADDAIVKLRSGSDFQWLRANADGQVDPKKAKDLMDFRGQLLDATTLDEGVRNALAGADAGAYRLFADPGKAYYVLLLRERIPSRPMPFESVKGEMQKKVFSAKLERVLRDWEEKLRKASDVKIYATGEKLDRIVNPGAR